MSRFKRLTSFDLMFLRLETAGWPCHFGGLATVEGGALLDSSGELRLPQITERLDRRLARIPKLRQRVHFPGPFGGRPLWVDDPQFDIRNHVHETAVESPGDDVQFLEKAAELYAGLLDRARPLWDLWFLTGLTDGRLGVLLKLHHSVADGMAAVAIMGSLFDFEPDAPDPESKPWLPEPTPGGWPLLADNLSRQTRTLGRGVAALADPASVLRRARRAVRVGRRGVDPNRIAADFGEAGIGSVIAPRTSLNQPVKAGRQIRFLRLDLARMKATAHAHGGKVNDVVLALWLGGLRQLLASRSEATVGVELITAVAVSLRSRTAAGTVDNESATMVLPLPAWEADVQRRLDLVVARTRIAKARQHPAAIAGFMTALAATPVGKYFSTHQHSTNVLVTNVVGPPVPVYVLGARILDILPIIQLIGNIGLTLCAFSYTGQVRMVVTADATAFPDLDVLIDGMERDWQALIRGRADSGVAEMGSEEVATSEAASTRIGSHASAR